MSITNYEHSDEYSDEHSDDHVISSSSLSELIFDEVRSSFPSLRRPSSPVSADTIWETQASEDRSPLQNLVRSWSCRKHLTEKQLRLPLESESESEEQEATGVRFSDIVEVRTHSVILGDHPSCKDGFALDLGWEYNDSLKSICNCPEPKNGSSWKKLSSPFSSRKRARTQRTRPQRLSYHDRYFRLLEVAGCTELELLEREKQILDEAIEKEEQQRRKDEEEPEEGVTTVKHDTRQNRKERLRKEMMPLYTVKKPKRVPLE